ncbi:MAG TPA: hypothetical protein VHR66_19385 [Gemmataceae bacterium]|jgi:uncharacterized membrane protein|nr:hypothetical protein [Gemmataceae bacterium]
MPRKQDDDDDDRPRRRRPADDDDDDDRPVARRKPKRDDDDDDDRPSVRRKPSRDDDDDDDRPKVRRRKPLDDDDDDEPRPKRRKKKSRPQQVGVAGSIAITAGIIALSMYFTCFGVFSIIPAGIGLILGGIGLVMALKSDGRQTPIVPAIGSGISLIATVLAIIAIINVTRTVKEIQKDIKEGQARYEKEEAERKRELAKAKTEVQAGASLRITAIQFAKAYEDSEERADALYKNKVLEITGIVDEVDFMGDTYTVILKAGKDETVHCEFAKDPAIRAQLGQLQPGMNVIIRGKCLGGGAVIEACVLVQ